ncbi:hypothetical protein OCU04_009995 [Sclerotinia nivalis]|uniref:Uncharacterized protein n=1 Tax=Sclerotinia nivalis TaxID=352851 RepID=A0A9X0DFU4_9HELO|nr:hypothetical protein OCU04_009995 [Sclerotinia nivalis]
MRFHTILLLALSILTQVSASSAAGPWQIVAFWYAYRISINAFGVDENKIAPEGRGSLSDGSCTFAEFAEYTRHRTKRGTPFPEGLLGADLTPDPLAAVTEIQKSGYKTSQYIDTYTLLPEKYATRDKNIKMPRFPEQIAALNEYVDEARVYMMNTQGLTQESIDSLPEFQNLKLAIRGTLDARRADFNSITLPKLTKALQDEKINPVVKLVIAVDLTTYYELDIDAIISRASNITDARTVVERIVAQVMEGDDQTVRHGDLIMELNKWERDFS